MVDHRLANNVSVNRRRIIRILVAVFAVATAGCVLSDLRERYRPAPADDAAVSDPDQIKRAVIISIDGLRPDLLLRANTPVIKGLMRQGSYTMWARTTEMSITLPSHTSMLTGVTPEYHGLVWNYYIPNVYPDVPTIFELAHRAGYTTALVSGKSKFSELATPGNVNWSEVYWDKVRVGPDLEVADSACAIVRRHQPEVLFMHLPQVDEAGHGIGWGTPQQIAAIERADVAVGRLIDALYEAGVYRETLIILSADHGGQGRSHGPNDPRSRHIPWIAVGPGIRENYDLTRDASLIVNTEDTFATACHLLQIPVAGKIDGKFVEQILTTYKPPRAKPASKPTTREIEERLEPAPYQYEWERIEPGHR